MFEKASRLKIRFDSPKGMLSVEDLWDLPLTSATGKANLDDIAKALHKQMKEDVEVSFVKKAQKEDSVLTLKFDIIRHIIEVRVQENEARQKQADTAEKKQKLQAILAQRQDQELLSLDTEALRKMLDEL